MATFGPDTTEMKLPEPACRPTVLTVAENAATQLQKASIYSTIATFHASRHETCIANK